MNTTQQIIDKSNRYIAGGVVSLNRKTELPIVFVKAQGSRLQDAEGREYLDYHAAFAPHLLGHNHPKVNAAVARAMEESWSLVGSGTTPWEARLAELLCHSVPNLDLVQIFNSGSEATANAIRECSRKHSLPLAEVNTVFTALGSTGEDASSLLRNPANSAVVDGVHPTAQGYALIATIIFQTIIDHRLPTSRVVCLGDSITMGIAMQGEGTATGETYPGRLAAMLRIASGVGR